MVFAYEVRAEERLILIRSARGDFNSQKCVDMVKHMVRDPAYGPSLGILADLRAVENVPSYQDTGFFLTFLAGVGAFREQPIAVVIDGPKRFAAVHMTTVIANSKGLNMCAFPNIEDARAWLAELIPDLTQAG